ncbi:hypothetical protein GCM10012275_31960 [Longimycelium tulufanense]|uniref:Uncharacterized protein n=1 Tax=Longimycelium tulufanense TaxID=907463 RepID=A0A8J3CDJ1_9PSEU|nr:hypothetical protein [Longimycelium tulufanense]GGM58350.1 hypothetical protein GCM10012275_31960 [Longimycelium tulufanense]
MDVPSTCGQGLAAHSVLPAKLGGLTAAVANVLETHAKALDLEDENAKQEHVVYQRLVEAHRQVATQLLATGREMAGYRDLPMGRHDPNLMASPEVAEIFEKFVQAEQELLALLQEWVEQDQTMLRDMGRME